MTRTPTRRGFALPMVVLVAFIAGLLIMVMLERASAQAMVVQKQYETYAFGHATRGFGEAIDAWIRSNQGKPIADALDQDGLAFELSNGDGWEVGVSLIDGQGAALADFSGLRGDTLDMAVTIVDALRTAAPRDVARLTRREGPLAVSVNSAPREVLEAVIDAATDGEGSKDVVAEIMAQRGGSRSIDDEALGRILGDSQVSGDARGRLTGLLTASPILWRVETQSRNRVTGARGPSYRAWAVISRARGGSGSDRSLAVQRAVSVFGWERVEDR